MEFKSLIINTVLISIVVIAFISFSGEFAINHNTNNSLISDPKLQDLNASLSSQMLNSTANNNNLIDQYQNETTHPILGVLGFYFTSIIDAGTSFFTISKNVFGYFPSVIQDYLGIPPIVTGSFFIILTVLILMGAWSAWRTGR